MDRLERFRLEIEGLTSRLVEQRVIRNWSREMSRLDDKWARAGGVVQRAEQHVEGKLDAFLAREDEVKEKTERVFAKQHAPLDAQMKALDALDRKLDLLSNGGPNGPLPGSEGSQEVTEPATESPQDGAETATDLERKELQPIATAPKRKWLP